MQSTCLGGRVPLSGKDPYAMTNKIQGEKCREKCGDYHTHTHTYPRTRTRTSTRTQPYTHRVGGPSPNRGRLEFKGQHAVEVLLDLSLKG